LDEGISVGDNEFQYKAKKQIWKLFNKNKTILIVSQDQKIIEQYSKKIIIMNRGIITDEGNKTILKKYFTN